MVKESGIEDLVDLERYPITRLDSPAGRALIARCQVELKTEGAANLDEFLLADAALALSREAEALLPQAVVSRHHRNVYVKPVDESWPQDHPGRCLMEGGR